MGIRISQLQGASGAEITDDTVVVINTPGGKTKKITWGLFKQNAPSMWTTVEVNSESGINNRSRVKADASGGAFIVKLPVAEDGLEVKIKKIDASANVVTIQPAAVGTIDSSASKPLSAQYESLSLWCDGTNWWID